MVPLLSQSRRFLQRSCGFMLALMLAQFGAASGAGAQNVTPLPAPGCSSSTATNIGAKTANTSTNTRNCQWHFANPGGTVGGGESGNAYGVSLYNGMAAPAPSISAGIRQDKGITSIMYDTYTNDCRFVDNISSKDLFVPQNTAREFEDFVDSFATSTKPTVVFGYCTQGITYPYTPKASMANNFQIFGEGVDNAEIDPQPVTYATKLIQINVPPMRVPTPFVYPQAPTPPITLSYFREDCRIDAAKATVCNQRPITETQVFTWVNFANPSPNCPGITIQGSTGANVGYGTAQIDSNTNCDGRWLTPTMASTYMVGNDPTQWMDPYEDFSPPGMESCDRGEFGNGASWLQTTTKPPFSLPCPAGDIGTQSCIVSSVTTETCNDGLVVAGTPVANPTICTASCTNTQTGGVCGATVGTCTTGTAQGASDDGTTTTWTCTGSNTQCSASDPVNGVCGTTIDICAPGTATGMIDNGTTTTWTCDGLYGGTNASCSASDN